MVEAEVWKEGDNMTDLSNLKDSDFSRENLIAICEAAVVPVEKWRNRDSPSSHEKLGLCTVMLKSGCKFQVHMPVDGIKDTCITDERTIWLTVEWPTFNTFELGEGYEADELIYLPTPARLRESIGGDWY